MVYRIDRTDITNTEIEYLYDLFVTQYPDVLNNIREPHYHANKTGLNSRVINYWFKQGLLKETRKESQTWRRFCLMDIVFIDIAQKLRQFGMCAQQIIKVRDSLFQPCITSDNNYLTWLEFAFFNVAALRGDGNQYLLVIPNGYACVLNQRDFAYNYERGNIPSAYIYINLNELFNGLFKGVEIHKQTEPEFINDSERELVTMTRNKNPNRTNVNVKFGKDGTMSVIEEFSQIDSKDSTLHDILNSIQYGDVCITRKGGKNTCITTCKTKKVGK